MAIPILVVAAPVVGAAVGKFVANQFHRSRQLGKDIRVVDDLQPGDILMKCRCGHVMNWIIEGVQTFSLRDTAYVTHGGVIGRNDCLIEMDGSGIVRSDLFVKNARYNYIIFRTQLGGRFANEVADVAEKLLEVHGRTGNQGYSIRGLPVAVAPRIEGIGGGTPSSATLTKRYEDIVSGKVKYNFFCTEFVAFCCQVAAIRCGINPDRVFNGPPVLFNPSYMAKCLLSNISWKREGALVADIRWPSQRKR